MKRDISVAGFIPQCLVSATINMSKSNPSALNGLLRKREDSLLKNHPHPELGKAAHHGVGHPAGLQGGGGDYRSASDVSHQWSDGTFTGSSRCSAYSWGLDEAEFDRVAAESVRKKFDRINSFLFEGKSTGTGRVDAECNEWSSTFPHLEVKGQHMLDTMEDGTEMVTPDPILGISLPSSEVPNKQQQQEDKLMVVGQKSIPVPMVLDEDEGNPLYEEVFVEDGILEEYFAYDKTDDSHTHGAGSNRLGHWRRRHGAVPPVTPNACVQDAVGEAAFNHLWGEVVVVLHPLLDAIQENSQAAQDTSFSVMDKTLTPSESVMTDSPQEKLYVLPEIVHPPSYVKTFGLPDGKLPRWKYTAPSVPVHGGSSYAPMAHNLSGLMQIRAVALQQRGHSLVPSVIPVGGNSREGTPLYPPLGNERPTSGLTAPRLGKLTTPLPPPIPPLHRPDFQPAIPPTPSSTALLPSNRLASSHLTSRRNINTAILKPIEMPKTPALVPIDNNGIRGFRLGVNPAHYSPPITPMVRHSQLPPLETSSSSSSSHHSSAVTTSTFTRIPPSSSYPSDKSPTIQHRISAQQRGRVTFNSSVASAAADDPEVWHYTRTISGAAGEHRPSTTNISLRPIEGHGINRKVSDGSAYFLGRMKVVGHAAGVHAGGGGGGSGAVGGANNGSGGVGGGGGEMIYGIEEDDELSEGTKSFAVTGKSGIVQTKPHSVSSKNKSRSQFR